MAHRQEANVKIILVLSLIHFVGDFYNSFIIPLLPLFIDKFSLTLAQAGLIIGLSRFLAFVVQPPVGYIADRHPSRLFALGGPLLVMVFIPLIGITPYFWMLVLFVCLGSVGSSMFHPTVAGMVEPYAGRHFGFAMSIFGIGGTLSFAIGPLFISWLVGAYGLSAMPFSMILGFAVLVFLYRTVPVPQASTIKSQGFINSIKEIFGPVWLPIMLIWMVMTLRAYVSQSFMTFLPVMVARQGYSLISIGALVSLFVFAGALSGLLAGHLSDRIGFKSVFICAHLLATPCMIAALYLPGYWIFVFAFLSGFFILATMPLGVALAQKLAPGGKSMASSLMMGLAYGMGGLLTPLTGKLADIFTIRPVLAALAIIPLLTVVLIGYLFRKDLSPVTA
ncbi:MAG: MFS transporter [Desulfobacterales bacterium]|nr:MFS transporter [Desulfobacterales bacterium]